METLLPGMLWGLGLVGVPIIIHLLNKRKFRVVEWAPMKYLRLTLTRTRRRLRLEQLLLLLVRCAFVAALVLGLSRPTLVQDGLLSLAGGGGRMARAIVLDDSLSMGLRFGAESSFSLGRSAVLRIIESMSPRDFLQVLAATNPSEPVSPMTEVREIENAARMVESIQLTDMTHRWAEAVREGVRALANSPVPVRELDLVTDLRAEGFGEDLEDAAAAAAAAGVVLRIVDVGGASSGNLVLLDLSHEGGAVVPRETALFRASVRNDGDEPFGPAVAVLRAGEASRSIAVPRIEPGATGEFPVEWRFEQPGSWWLSLELPEDALPGDNRRFCAVEVRENLVLHLVDGNPSDEPFEGETDFLAVAFTVGAAPWRVYSFTDAEWLGARPATPDLLVLANLMALPPDRARWVAERVRAGMGLMVFPGDQMDVPLWDRLADSAGEGLLPCPLVEVRDGPVQGIVVEPVENSPLASLARLSPEALAEVRVDRFLDVRPEASGSGAARVLMRYDHGDAPAAVVERACGRGRVLLSTTSANRAWTDWPVDPTWLMAMREMGMAAAAADSSELNLQAGRSPALSTGSRPVLDARLKAPGALADFGMASGEDGEGGYRVVWGPARHAGIYEAKWTGEDGAGVLRRVAVNPVALESRLDRMDERELRRLLRGLDVEIVHHSALGEVLEQPGREIWRWFVWIAAAFLAVESLLMVYAGRRG